MNRLSGFGGLPRNEAWGDFPAVPSVPGPEGVPLTAEGFEQLKGRRCEVLMPDGARFVGVPRHLEPEDFILVETGDGVVAVEYGHGAQIRLLE